MKIYLLVAVILINDNNFYFNHLMTNGINVIVRKRPANNETDNIVIDTTNNVVEIYENKTIK